MSRTLQLVMDVKVGETWRPWHRHGNTAE